MSDVLQMLHQLEKLIQGYGAEQSAMRVVLRSVAETHPNRSALLLDLRRRIDLQSQTDQGQPLTDEQIADRQARVEKWLHWIESA